METNDQEFYELDANGQPVLSERQPVEGPRPKKAPPWLRYVIVILVLLVVALLTVWLLRTLMKDAGPGEMTQEEYNGVYAQIEDDLIACEDEGDVERCQDRIWTAKAREMQDPDVCLQASDAFAEDCVSGIAFDLLDESFCDVLDGAQYDHCRDSVLYLVYVEQGNYGACESLTDASLVSRCQGAVSTAVAAEGGCVEAGISGALCDDEIWMQQAIDSGNFIACNWLARSVNIETCKDKFHSIDSDSDGLVLYDEYVAGTSDASADTDGDGLNDFEEVNQYGTDPTNPDTDGDGYSDGEELSAGFDPLTP